jgi:hypothetical protein
MTLASKDVFGDAALTKSLSTLNAYVKEITSNKTVCAELAQLLLSSTLPPNHVKATSFVAMTNSWLTATANARLDLTELMEFVLDALSILILILSPKAADATKDST